MFFYLAGKRHTVLEYVKSERLEISCCITTRNRLTDKLRNNKCLVTSGCGYVIRIPTPETDRRKRTNMVVYMVSCGDWCAQLENNAGTNIDYTMEEIGKGIAEFADEGGREDVQVRCLLLHSLWLMAIIVVLLRLMDLRPKTRASYWKLCHQRE